MGIAFDTPLALLLLPVLVAFVLVLHAGSRRRLGAGRRRAALLVRVLVLASLVAALAGLQLVLAVDRLSVVFVADLSDSVGGAGRDEALTFIKDSLAKMPDGDVSGVVAFGRDALVERLPSDLDQIDRLASTPVRNATDVGAALRLATALFPDDAQKRIVLLSDGNDTTGAGQTEAALAAARGVQVETHVIGLQGRDEALVERLDAPSTARLGEEIQATAQVRSTVGQPATLRLFVDGTLASTQPVTLEAGANRVTFRFKPADAGFHTFRVALDVARDTFAQNNRADAHTIVKGEPRVLVVAGDGDVAADLVKALQTERQQVAATTVPESMPDTLEALLTYDSVVLVDVPRLRITDKAMAALQAYVRDLGRGLVMVGGPKSYGAGGYAKTALEETLPVDMGVRDRQKQPDIALVVVIDKSGSMDACHCNSFDAGMGGARSGIAGVRKVDIGKEAILRAAAALTPTDQLGVVAFDSAAHWAIRTAPLGSLADIQAAIGGIQPLGTTNIFAGLDQAVQSLETTTATRRHIILLTDGWSTSGEYTDILKRMKADNITLSTVGAGGGSNPFLSDLARQGGGRFYPAANPASIPDIFLKETQQVSGQQIVEEPFFPTLTSSSPIVRGIESGFPQLLGYNGTTAKPAAQTVLVTGRDDPLLAQWQYGLGRSVAWTSDATGRWAKNWIAWPGFSRFFSQLVGWTFPGEETAGIEASFVNEAGKMKLRVQSEEADGSPRDFYATVAHLVGPGLEPVDVPLPQTAPGVYEAPLGELDSGAYAVRVTQTRSGSSALGRTLGLVAPTAAEYWLLGANESLLAAIRTATAGGVAGAPADVWRHDLAATRSFTELWPWLLVIALLLWPLDIALRRVSLGRRELVDGRRWLAATLRGRRVAARTQPVEDLLAARKRAGSSAARAAILRPGDEGARPAVPTAAPVTRAATAGAASAARAVSAARPESAPPPESNAAPGTTTAESGQAPEPAAEADDTLSRLRAAKKRAGR